ncbi:hypothetical protein JNUCC1_03667 [Lentibacillus sp. JNUCC-1]|uniref:DUF2487 family protein n=1 Tax=Lentibacillus sp. JNUCC-1 TaxID=2654513 RepID=UPI0012E8B12C|nr:DUF2487 family protein [Lentibacillus sp. JNUCC-1]MUV39783.1 hypothetical protein [Lentibacillus sp. JNUCC-1]
MKWTKSDLSRFLEAQEYVDTVIIPLVPFQFSHEKKMGKDAFQAELVYLFAQGVEQELAGRVILTPAYHYVKSTDKHKEAERVAEWEKEIKSQPFKHVFYLTFDPSWKKNEKALEGTLLWFPAISANGDAHSSVDVLRPQVEQVVELIRSYWE